MHVLLFLVVVLSLTGSISHRKAHLTQRVMFQHNLVRQHLPPHSRQMKLLLCLQIYARHANVLYWKMNYIYCIRCDICILYIKESIYTVLYLQVSF